VDRNFKGEREKADQQGSVYFVRFCRWPKIPLLMMSCLRRKMFLRGDSVILGEFLALSPAILADLVYQPPLQSFAMLDDQAVEDSPPPHFMHLTMFSPESLTRSKSFIFVYVVHLVLISQGILRRSLPMGPSDPPAHASTPSPFEEFPNSTTACTAFISGQHQLVRLLQQIADQPIFEPRLMLVSAFTVRSSLTLPMISTKVSSMWISCHRKC